MFSTRSPLGVRNEEFPCVSLGLDEFSGNGDAVDNEQSDLALFPDLHGLRRSFSRCSSQESAISGAGPENPDSADGDLLGYLSRDCVSGEAVPERSETRSRTPEKPHAPTPSEPRQVKVIRLLPANLAGGAANNNNHQSIFMVESGNDRRLPSTVNPVVISQPRRSVSPTSSDGGRSNGQPGNLCMSKNAVAARENRQRKKQHITVLEESVEKLSAENNMLKTNVSEMSNTIDSLRTEVDYLRSVLANQSTLSALLRKIPSVSGIDLLSSELKQSQPQKNLRSCQTKSKRACRKRKIQECDDSECEEEDTVILAQQNHDISCPQKENLRVHNLDVANRPEGPKLSKLDHSYASSTCPGSSEGNVCSGGEDSNCLRGSNSVMKMKTRSARQTTESTEAMGGVCLHVSGKTVSLEFCADCSRKSASAANVRERNGKN